MICLKRVNWKREFQKLDKENIEYYRRLEMSRMKELICQAVYKCEDKEGLKLLLEISCDFSGMRFVGGSIDKMHIESMGRSKKD